MKYFHCSNTGNICPHFMLLLGNMLNWMRNKNLYQSDPARDSIKVHSVEQKPSQNSPSSISISSKLFWKLKYFCSFKETKSDHSLHTRSETHPKKSWISINYIFYPTLSLLNFRFLNNSDEINNILSLLLKSMVLKIWPCIRITWAAFLLKHC